MTDNPTPATPALPQAQAQGTQGHTRTYQACIPCRKRKVRCDLGPVDNPHDPPCVRCRREHKDCYFSPTRRKRNPQDSGDGLDDQPDFDLQNGRKRLKSHPDDLTPEFNPHHRPSTSLSSLGVERPLTPGGSLANLAPLRPPPRGIKVQSDEEDQKVNNETAAMLQTAEIYNGHDALNLLWEAAGHNGDVERHGAGGFGGPKPTAPNIMGTPMLNTGFPSPQTPMNPGVNPQGQQRSVSENLLDPAMAQQYANSRPQSSEGADQIAIKAWSRFRFVRAGWFTAREAIAYVDYFYNWLNPLTPIMVPDYRDHASHPQLLSEEPMLVVTILTISSRYMKLNGPGAASRPHTIHQTMWNYLQGMMNRLVWGQEQFGGGFCGAGGQPASDVNPLSRKGLRTLGTVESLMLLTEWHPRALHFPPGDDDDELMVPENPTFNNAHTVASTPVLLNGTGGQRVDSWLEPCWRSDRMCWMLLSNAMGLAFEIGVFDETSEVAFSQENQALPQHEVQAYFQRKSHLQELLQIYITQTSGRLGLTSMLPSSYLESAHLKSPPQRLEERLEFIRRSQAGWGRTASGISSSAGQLSPAQAEVRTAKEMVLYFWTEIAAIMESGNKQMFPNRKVTRDLIKGGKYTELLQFFQPRLRTWWANFETCKNIPQLMRYILTIEYEYSRVYLNSLALQAVVERCTNNTPMKQNAQLATTVPMNGRSVGEHVNAVRTDGGAIPLATIMKWAGNDRQYIAEVVDACRNVLKVVVEGLHPNDYLKHAPVRTYFRIISVAIILLKTFALGSTADDVAISLAILDKAVSCLRTCIVDDVHIGNRFADLCETLSKRIRTRFVRMSAPGAGSGTSRGGTPGPMAPTAGPQPPMTAPLGNAHGLPQGVPQWYQNGMNQVPVSGSATPINHDSLWGISTESYDPESNMVSIMPPPNFNMNGGYDTNGNAYTANGAPDNANSGDFDTGMPSDDMSDWLALPLDPLLGSYGADVTQTMYGPDVGGFDMLDVLLQPTGDGGI